MQGFLSSPEPVLRYSIFKGLFSLTHFTLILAALFNFFFKLSEV